MVDGLVILNFSHPLPPVQQARVADLAGGMRVDGYLEVPVHLDRSADIAAQISSIVGETGLTSEDWQTRPIVVVLPGLAEAAAALLAHLHGITGYFVTVAMTARRPGLAQTYEVTQLVSLQDLRDGARQQRW